MSRYAADILFETRASKPHNAEINDPRSRKQSATENVASDPRAKSNADKQRIFLSITKGRRKYKDISSSTEKRDTRIIYLRDNNTVCVIRLRCVILHALRCISCCTFHRTLYDSSIHASIHSSLRRSVVFITRCSSSCASFSLGSPCMIARYRVYRANPFAQSDEYPDEQTPARVQSISSVYRVTFTFHVFDEVMTRLGEQGIRRSIDKRRTRRCVTPSSDTCASLCQPAIRS